MALLTIKNTESQSHKLPLVSQYNIIFEKAHAKVDKKVNGKIKKEQERKYTGERAWDVLHGSLKYSEKKPVNRQLHNVLPPL